MKEKKVTKEFITKTKYSGVHDANEEYKKKLLKDAESLNSKRANIALKELKRLDAREELYGIATNRKFLKYTPETRRNAERLLDDSELE